jgi:hypothetical protein
MCCAVVCSNYAVAKELLQLTHPPDLNHKVAIGHTALSQAQRLGLTSIINLLSAAETQNSKHARS